MVGLATGGLDRRIAVERATITRDEENGQVETWRPYGTFHARQLRQAAGEAERAGQLGASAALSWQVRWSPLTAGITAKDRLRVDGRVYRITGVVETVTRTAIEITGVANADGGGEV